MGNTVFTTVRVSGFEDALDAIERELSTCIMDLDSGQVDLERLDEVAPSVLWSSGTLLWLEREPYKTMMTIIFRTDWESPSDAIEHLSGRFPRTVLVASSGDPMAKWRHLYMATSGQLTSIDRDDDWDAFEPEEDDDASEVLS